MTDKRTERDHIQQRAYKDGDALRTRIRIHRAYTVPPIELPDWVLDQVGWRGDESVLDIGCGSGEYTEPIRARLVDGGRLVGIDLSMGMLRERPTEHLRAAADAIHLPFPDASFDRVFANHLLFFIDDIRAAVREVHRVLRPGGRFVATTNTRDSLSRFEETLRDGLVSLGYPDVILPPSVISRFPLEDGTQFFEGIFSSVSVHRLDRDLIFEEALPPTDYINSTWASYAHTLPDDLTWKRLMESVHDQIEGVIAAEGEYRVAKGTGVIVGERKILPNT